MISPNIHIPLKTADFKAEIINKGVWLIILHANRIPPHAAIMFDGNYNSLTIKEFEININSDLILNTVTRKKIKSFFIKVRPHPVFSVDHQLAMFQEYLKTAGCVKQDEATCMTPVKQFFQEFYGLKAVENELLFEFVQRLNENGFAESVSALNHKLINGIDLPNYSVEELNEKIKQERQPYYND